MSAPITRAGPRSSACSRRDTCRPASGRVSRQTCGTFRTSPADRRRTAMDRSIAVATLIVTTLALASGAAGAASVTATVTAIDPATGAITLTAAQGRQVTLTAAQEVKNLEEVKVGDLVDVEYLE